MEAVAACRLATTAVLAAVTLASGRPGAEEPASLLQAPGPVVAALRSRFGNGLRIRRLAVLAESADVEAQDPAVPAHLDRYVFEDGALGPPEPIQAGRNQRRLEASLFPFAEVDLGLMPRLLADARRRARTADARVAQVLIERTEGYGDSGSWGRPLLRVVVDGPRGGAVVEYRLDGKHTRTTRW